MAFASINGIDLYYETHGKGPAVVFAHGAGGNHLSWWQQVPVFAEEYRCISVDHRGFGQSPDVARQSAARRPPHGHADPMPRSDTGGQRLARGDDALGALRAIYGVAGAQPEACRAFYQEGPERVMDELAAYLRRAHSAGTLKVKHPLQAADLFLSMFFGSAHMRGLLKLETPEPRENRALLREAVRVFMAAYGA